ncbi:hypothetical protein NRY67_03350, partial [Acidithiobacillus ferrooxidans]
ALIFGFMAFMLFLARDTVPVTPSTTDKPAYQAPKPSQKFLNNNPSPYANPDPKQPNGWSLSLLRDLEWKRFEDFAMNITVNAVCEAPPQGLVPMAVWIFVCSIGKPAH